MLQFAQPIEECARLVNAAAQHHVIEESSIARLRFRQALRLEMIEKFLAGDHLLVDQATNMLRNDRLCKVEFDEKKQARQVNL